MREPVEPARINGFNFQPRAGIQVLGGSLFLSSLPRQLEIRRTTMTLEDVIAAVLLQEGLTREQLFSRSQKRSEYAVVLARALIAFHATERRISSYSQIAHLFGLDSSTLIGAAKTHRAKRPELFQLKALHNAGPLLPIAEQILRLDKMRSAR
jgi:hypothetical protein